MCLKATIQIKSYSLEKQWVQNVKAFKLLEVHHDPTSNDSELTSVNIRFWKGNKVGLPAAKL